MIIFGCLSANSFSELARMLNDKSKELIEIGWTIDKWQVLENRNLPTIFYSAIHQSQDKDK
jgi:hypothetical protein